MNVHTGLTWQQSTAGYEVLRMSVGVMRRNLAPVGQNTTDTSSTVMRRDAEVFERVRTRILIRRSLLWARRNL